jgi:putative flippase GtrA
MKTLLRCAGSSIAAVAVEFGLLTLLVSVLHVFYMVGAAISALLYLLVSFLLNRRWAFRATDGARWPQLARHTFVAFGGMALSMPMLWLLVGGAKLPYQPAWLLGGTISFFCWTWPMQRFFTYRVAPAD